MSLVLPAPRVRMSRDDLLMRLGVVALVLVLLLMVGLPLWTLLAKGFEDRDGHFVGLANYAAYFSTPALFNSALNSFQVAAVSNGTTLTKNRYRPSHSPPKAAAKAMPVTRVEVASRGRRIPAKTNTPKRVRNKF